MNKTTYERNQKIKLRHLPHVPLTLNAYSFSWRISNPTLAPCSQTARTFRQQPKSPLSIFCLPPPKLNLLLSRLWPTRPFQVVIEGTQFRKRFFPLSNCSSYDGWVGNDIYANGKDYTLSLPTPLNKRLFLFVLVCFILKLLWRFFFFLLQRRHF